VNIEIKKDYYQSGELEEKSFYKNGKLHRRINYFRSGKIRSESHYQNNKLHRDNDLPARIRYYEYGKMQSKHYCLNNKYHRDNNLPAAIWYYESGKTEKEFYFLDGKEHTKAKYFKILEEIKNLPEGVRLTDNRKWVRELIVNNYSLPSFGKKMVM